KRTQSTWTAQPVCLRSASSRSLTSGPSSTRADDDGRVIGGYPRDYYRGSCGAPRAPAGRVPASGAPRPSAREALGERESAKHPATAAHSGEQAETCPALTQRRP